MPKTGTFQFGFPRFKGAVREIVLLSAGIWVFLILLSAFDKQLAASFKLLHGCIRQMCCRGECGNSLLMDSCISLQGKYSPP